MFDLISLISPFFSESTYTQCVIGFSINGFVFFSLLYLQIDINGLSDTELIAFIVTANNWLIFDSNYKYYIILTELNIVILWLWNFNKFGITSVLNKWDIWLGLIEFSTVSPSIYKYDL